VIFGLETVNQIGEEAAASGMRDDDMLPLDASRKLPAFKRSTHEQDVEVDAEL
jgi:hypothetical protein